MEKDKDDEPKSVADYWINPAFRERKPGPRGIVIPTGGKPIIIRTSGKPVEKKDDQAK